MSEDPDNEAWTRKMRRRRDEKEATFADADRTPLSDEAFNDFDGLDWFPLEESFVWTGRLEPAGVVTVDLFATRGPPMAFDRVAQFGVQVDGSLRVFDVYQAPGVDPFLLPFRDATNGEATWEEGRYVTVDNPWSDGERQPTDVTVDFNEAYHPLCVYDSTVRSALPPEENYLDVEVRAGERRPE